MMAGVGFGGSENVYYVYGVLGDAVEHTRQTGEASALIVPIYANVVQMMVWLPGRWSVPAHGAALVLTFPDALSARPSTT